MIRRASLTIAVVFAMGAAFAQDAIDSATATKGENGILWYNALEIGLEGKGWTDTEHPYDRLPSKAKGVVPDPVWSLSHDSAGMAVRFVTDASAIRARWTVRDEGLAMPHMPATGVSGLDLYVRGGDGWGWIAQGRPSAVSNEAELATGIPEGSHEYLLYLPLYNGTESLEIGIPESATLSKAPARPEDHAKPVLVYGTSIVHGGCAARPGMAYPAIMGRWLDRPFINLGFSGNGKMEIEMADLLGELDCAVYVIDCAPNMAPELIAERVVPFVKRLREIQPETPILLVENIEYQAGWFIPAKRDAYVNKNVEWKKAFDTLQADGVANLHYFPCDALLGDDHEGTVDGTHPTDLGFYRMAQALEPIVRELCD
ncbi:MAG: hydrolase [Candidatus Hydrogenedentota bacterium]